jgi:hypothetical protein
MFEKKNEFERQIGPVKASVDITPELKLQVTLELDLIAEAKKLAERTNTPLDNHAIAWLELLVKKAA